MKKTLCLLIVLELFLLSWYKNLTLMGSDYGLNKPSKFNTRLQYEIRPVFLKNGFMYDGRMCLAKNGKVNSYPIEDIACVDRENMIMGMSGYLWDHDNLYVVFQEDSEIVYYRPELVTDIEDGSEDVVFKKIDDNLIPSFNIANYRQTKGINRLCYHILYLKGRIVLEMIIVLLVIICISFVLFYKWIKSKRNNRIAINK